VTVAAPRTPGGDGGPGAIAALGVDIGGTKVLGVALDVAGRVVAEGREPTPYPQGDGSSLAADVADAVTRVVAGLEQATGSSGRPVGVGAPGMVDRRAILVFAPNLPPASGADLGRLLASRLPGTELTVENDANCAALAELRRGSAQGADEVLVVTLGTGIGGGWISGGRVVTGARGFAGEIGHMVVDPSGPPCPCGRRGCWERFASGGGLGRLAREAAYGGGLPAVVELAGGDPESVRGEHVTAAARHGDAGALAVLDELGWWVALGLANLVAVVDPSRVVLGGGLAGAGELLLAPTRRAFAELVEGGDRRPAIEIVPAALGERAGAVGAALGALEGRPAEVGR